MVLYACNRGVDQIMSNGQPSPQEVFVLGQLINLIRSGQATTRPALEQATGLRLSLRGEVEAILAAEWTARNRK